jgi:hypothetical protein
VVIVLDPDGEIDLGAGAGQAVQLTFTSANWSTTQVITVTAEDDSDVEGGHWSILSYDVVSGDAKYDLISLTDTMVAIKDNDSSGGESPPSPPGDDDPGSPPEFDLSGVFAPDEAHVGDEVAFLVLIKNTDDRDASDVQATVRLAGQVQWLMTRVDAMGVTRYKENETDPVSERDVMVGSIPAGESATLVVVARPLSAGLMMLTTWIGSDDITVKVEVAEPVVIAEEGEDDEEVLDSAPPVPPPCGTIGLAPLMLMLTVWFRKNRHARQ